MLNTIKNNNIKMQITYSQQYDTSLTHLNCAVDLICQFILHYALKCRRK